MSLFCFRFTDKYILLDFPFVNFVVVVIVVVCFAVVFMCGLEKQYFVQFVWGIYF